MKSLLILGSQLLFPIVWFTAGSFWLGLATSTGLLILIYGISGLLVRYRVYVYDLSNYQPLPLFKGWTHRTIVMALAISPDNKYLISGEYSAKAYIWDIASRRKISKITSCAAATPETFTGNVGCITFSRDGRMFIGCSNGAIRIFDPKSGRELVTIAATAPVKSIYLSDNDEKVWTIEPLFMTEDKEIVHSYDHDKRTFELSEYCMRCYSVTSATVVTAIDEDDPFLAGVVTPDGRQLVTLHADDEGTNPGQKVVLYSTQSGEQLDAFSVTGFRVISASNELVAGSSWDGDILLYSLETHQPVRILSKEGNSRGLLFSPDGQTLAVSIEHRHDDMAIALFNPHNGEELMKIDTINSNWGLNMAFSPDGKFFTTAGVRKGERMYGED